MTPERDMELSLFTGGSSFLLRPPAGTHGVFLCGTPAGTYSIFLCELPAGLAMVLIIALRRKSQYHCNASGRFSQEKIANTRFYSKNDRRNPCNGTDNSFETKKSVSLQRFRRFSHFFPPDERECVTAR